MESVCAAHKSEMRQPYAVNENTSTFQTIKDYIVIFISTSSCQLFGSLRLMHQTEYYLFFFRILLPLVIDVYSFGGQHCPCQHHSRVTYNTITMQTDPLKSILEMKSESTLFLFFLYFSSLGTYRCCVDVT